MWAKLAIAAAALLSLTMPGRTQGPALSPIGLWQTLDADTKQPTAWFLIGDHGGVYAGIIAKMFLKPGEDPNRVCDQCKDDRYNHPWLGLEIIRGMQPEGDAKFGGGTILDPRDGKIYQAEMTVTPDNQTLVVRGYIGISLLGQNQYWTRLPNSAYSALDPSINPNAAVNPKPPASAHKSQATSPQINSMQR